MSSKNTSSTQVPSPLHSPESTHANIDRLGTCVYDRNTTTNMYNPSLSHSNSSSSAATNSFGSHAPAIRKAMKILEAQFGHPHISLSSSSSTNRNVNINDVANNNQMITVNASVVVDPRAAINVVATGGADVGDGNKNKRKKKEKIINGGRIHSLPHPKYGPYTCSQCFEVVPTSQKFANHVTNHYKARMRSDVQCDQSDVAHVNDEDHNQIASAPPLGELKVKIEPTNN